MSSDRFGRELWLRNPFFLARLCFPCLSVSGAQSRSYDDDCGYMAGGSISELGQISTEIEISWDSCASLQFFPYCQPFIHFILSLYL